MKYIHRNGWLAILLFGMAMAAPTQESAVTAQVELKKNQSGEKAGDASNVVVWLTPLPEAPEAGNNEKREPRVLRLPQRNKAFEPRVLVVEVGTKIDFPNYDPFFHNVFSLFNGKRFDLGLYEAGSSRAVRFDRPGVSYLFCNIHPEMSAAIVVVKTPYYGISDRSGRVRIPEVPPGRYLLHVWYESGVQESLESLSREVVVSETSRFLGTIRVDAPGKRHSSHKNKYGRDYDPPSPSYTKP